MSGSNSGTKPKSGSNSEFVDPAAATAGTNSGNSSGDNGGSIRDKLGNEFDASIHSHPDNRNADGSFRRKRGRRTGGSNSKSKAQIYSDIEKSAEMLTRGLIIFHASLASMTKTPELLLDEAEAKGLSESGLTLLSLYDIRPDPRIEAAILFASQVGLVYGTRIVAIKARKATEKKAKDDGKATVYNPDGTFAGTTDFAPEWPVPPVSPVN